MRLKYEPASEPLHISVKLLFLNQVRLHAARVRLTTCLAHVVMTCLAWQQAHVLFGTCEIEAHDLVGTCEIEAHDLFGTCEIEAHGLFGTCEIESHDLFGTCRCAFTIHVAGNHIQEGGLVFTANIKPLSAVQRVV